MESLSHRPTIEADQTGYLRRMDSSLRDKFDHTFPFVHEVTEFASFPTIVSIGAGSGKLEAAIATQLSRGLVVGIDLSLPMIEHINSEADYIRLNHILDHTIEPVSSETAARLIALQADATALPVAERSLHAIVASSVVHELASFADQYTFGPTIQKFFTLAATKLIPGGRFVLRDFVQPPNPDSEVIIEIGTKQLSTDTKPATFVSNFVTQFRGLDMTNVAKQIDMQITGRLYGPSTRLLMSQAQALELLVHYSWSKRFTDEIKERYAYLPLEAYTAYIQECFAKVGRDTRVVAAHSYLQKEYPHYIDERLNLFDTIGNRLPVPSFTGCIVVETLN